MIIQRLAFFGLLAVLPLMAACNQTTASPPAAPAADPQALGSGVHAALADVKATRERHEAQSTGMAVMSFFDPIGVTDLAEPIMEAEQRRELDEKYRRVEEEALKTAAEAEAIKAQHRTRETRSKARSRPHPAAQ